MSYYPTGDSADAVDGTTVIGGALSNVGDSAYLSESFSKKPSNGKGIQMPIPETDTHSRGFFETAEYMDTDRSFFITIGKDGLIAALQKLDTQLRNVSSYTRGGTRQILRNRTII